jgi:hypothetical protein
MSDTPATMTKSEFATANGWAKSYVSKLGSQGRLVLDADGRVKVAESLALIQGTTRAPERASEAAQTVVGGDARDRKAHYDAENARIDLEERLGNLMARAEVVGTLANVAALLRQRLTTRSAMMAPQLSTANGDEARIRTLLADHDEQTLAEVSRQFAKLAGEGPEA